jgi:hypothetical protein
MFVLLCAQASNIHPKQLTKIMPNILGILKNQEILAINQDPVVGKSISPFRWGYNVSFSFSGISSEST